MAPLSLLVLLAHLGFCWTEYIRDGGRPRLRIFHHSCALKKDEGPCKAVKDRFYFDIDTGRCEPFEYGGCQGNANNFETVQHCEDMCMVKANKSPCHLEDEPGPCRGLVPRYFFDSKKQECRRFFYGGCFGNANNFKTLKECHDRCQRNVTQQPRHDVNPVDTIKLSEEPVLHSETFRNVSSQMEPRRQPQSGGETETFRDASSQMEPQRQPESGRETAGNVTQQPRHDANPVDTIKLSEEPVLHSDFIPPEFCLSPITRGHYCDDQTDVILKRYVYNPKLQRCQQIRYRGCGGNKNNFIYKRQCMKLCMNDHQNPRQIRIKTKNIKNVIRTI